MNLLCKKSQKDIDERIKQFSDQIADQIMEELFPFYNEIDNKIIFNDSLRREDEPL